MAKKQTPGKGGAKGMHHGHTYKETCMCAICKSKRKKLDPSQGFSLPPLFERKDTTHEYVAVVTYKGINEGNYTGTFSAEKGEMVFVIGGVTKVFDCPDHEVSEVRTIVHTINEDVLTVLIPRKQQTPLTAETVNQFTTTNEQTVNKKVSASIETATAQKTPIDKGVPETSPTNGNDVRVNDCETHSRGSASLSGEITITEETYAVMNSVGGKLVFTFKLQKGFDHDKFVNDLVNRSIVFYCNNLK